MKSRRFPGRSSLGALAFVAASQALPAAAAPPGDGSVAVERLFGISRTTVDYEPGDATTYTDVSIASKVGGQSVYSAPRLAFDFLAGSGLTFGGALGYHSRSVEGSDGGDAVLLAARIGYFVRASSGFGLWPRAGLTHVILGDENTATALTLEVPLEFLLSRGIALTLTPHADIGIGGSAGDLDRTVTEVGLQFGVGLFF